MTRGRRTLAVCHDAGGARTLIPVANELKHRGMPIKVVTAGPSIPIWRKECSSLSAVEVSDSMTVPEAVQLLKEYEPDTLLSASGLYNQIEHTFRLAAQTLHIRSLAVLDSWLNYGERFQREANGAAVICRPDTVCVIDVLSYQGLLSAGFTSGQLVLTGPPNIEATVRFCRSVSPQQREFWRAEQGLSTDDFVITFFSDPFYIGANGEHFEGPGALIGPKGKSLFGYTSIEILTAVLEDLEEACKEARRSCKMIIKPHPAEYAECLRSVVDLTRISWLDVSVRAGGNAAQWIVMADVLMGMMTIALLEAALVGKPSLSVEIGLLDSGADDPCVSNLLGYTVPIYQRSRLREAMRHICSGNFQGLKTSPRCLLPIEGATVRVVNVVLDHTDGDQVYHQCS